MDSESRVSPEAYSYHPPPENIQTGQGKTYLRFIFYNVEFNQYECTQLAKFKKAILEYLPHQQLPAFYTDEELLRILVGADFKTSKACGTLVNSIAWRGSRVNYNFLDNPNAKEMLEQGFLYVHGVDVHFRPLIVVNFSRFTLDRFSIHEYSELLCFIMDYLIKYYTLPGQIENWVAITDLCNISTISLPFGEIKTIAKTLQQNYKCRMFTNFTFNAPFTVRLIWNVVKNFLDHKTVRKVRIFKDIPQEMTSLFRPNQLERKYGGTAPDVVQSFWPPIMPGSPHNY